jgi:hypothetical protein
MYHPKWQNLAREVFLQYTLLPAKLFSTEAYQPAEDLHVQTYERAPVAPRRIPGETGLPALFLECYLDCHWRHCRWNKDIVKDLRGRFESDFVERRLGDLGVKEPAEEAIEAIFWTIFREAHMAYFKY